MASEKDDLLLTKAIRELALRIGSSSEDLVLVGGQSVVFWAERFNIPLPDIGALTADVDFLANKVDIPDAEMSVSNLYSTRLMIAEMDESSPNSGVLSVDYPGIGSVNVDFLRSITGVDTIDAFENSFPWLVDGSQINLISPLLLLRSKISNLGTHPNKRNEEGISQANLAVQIVKEYLKDRCEQSVENGTKLPYMEFESVIRFARCDAALYCNRYFQIDVLNGLPLELLKPDDPFLVKRMPVVLNQIAIKREKFDLMIERMEKFDNHLESSRFTRGGDLPSGHKSTNIADRNMNSDAEVTFPRNGDCWRPEEILDSEVIAKRIAAEKGSFEVVKADGVYSGVLMGETNCHVVLSLGRSALIVEKTDREFCEGVKQGDELTVTIKDGIGEWARVAGKEMVGGGVGR